MMELVQQRVVRLRGNQLMHHGNGRGKEPRDIGVARRRGEACRQEGCACTGMANEHDITVGGDAVEVAQRQETGFLFLAGCMVVEVALVNRQFFCEGGLAPSEMDGVVPALLQFDVREEREGRDNAEVCLRSLLQGGLQVLEQAVEAEGGELVFEPWGVRHVRVLVMTKAA
jgi:hypothetical protein